MVTPATKTPAAQRADLPGDDVVQHLRELAADAPPLTDEQRDVVAAAFRGAKPHEASA
jgi:hypothetical protein